MPDRLFWPATPVHFLDYFDAVVGIVRYGGYRPVTANSFACLPRESSCCISISPHSQTKINLLAALINGTPQIAPASVNPHLSFVYVPLQAAPAEMSSVSQFSKSGAKLLNPPIHSSCIN
jgi:hypothetical protein